MKKILLCLISLFIFGACSNKYHALGYTNKEVSTINSLSDENKVLFDDYSDELATLLRSDNFLEDNINTYLKYVNVIDADKIVDLVNDETLKSSNFNIVKEFVESKDFNIDYIKEYLSKYKKINDPTTVMYIINNDLKVNTYLVNRLIKDDYYIVYNLDKYAEYYDNTKTIRENVEYVNTLNYLTYYENGIYAQPDKYGINVQVNKFYYLGEDYNPDDLVELGSYGYGSLRKEAYDAFVLMSEDAKKDNISFYATSSYRSYDRQVTIYNNYLKIDPQEEVDIYSARPGFSDHQSGYTVDILKQGYDFDTFFSCDASKWLADNAYKYGFICRYPEGKATITGYKYEPWHYRYVGIEAATYIQEHQITYDEYFEYFIKEW